MSISKTPSPTSANGERNGPPRERRKSKARSKIRIGSGARSPDSYQRALKKQIDTNSSSTPKAIRSKRMRSLGRSDSLSGEHENASTSFAVNDLRAVAFDEETSRGVSLANSMVIPMSSGTLWRNSEGDKRKSDAATIVSAASRSGVSIISNSVVSSAN